MKRDLAALAGTTYDAVIIGGGIYGATLAWEAALRGLSVALIEQADFGSGASANSLKTIHGGLRYLQHADIRRMRQSIRERSTLLRIAPHLVNVLPVLVPTYGHGMKGKEVMAVATRINDALSMDRNRGLDASKHIPNAHIISKAETLALAPGIRTDGLTGGCVFYDAQAYNTERLTLAFLLSAENIGAVLANYTKAVGFLRWGDQVMGVRAQDQLTGAEFEIQAKRVINTSGAWIDCVTDWLKPAGKPLRLAKAINVITRPLFKDHAVGLRGQGRLYFVSPWRGWSLIGTDYYPYTGDPSALRVTTAEVTALVAAINDAIPSACLTVDDVTFVHRGLLPLKPGSAPEDVQLSQHPRLIDHGVGLITVEGVKYTTAREVAVRAVDLLFKSLKRTPAPSVSDLTPLYGGALDSVEEYLHEQLDDPPHELSPPTIRRLVANYGSEYRRVIGSLDETAGDDAPETLRVLRAEARHAVRREMALTLADVIFRRTDWGSAAPLQESYLWFVARVMAGELGWSNGQIEREIDAVRAVYRWRDG